MSNYNSSLIESLDDEAFSFAKHELYNVISYKYLKESDIRKIDLIEEFFRLTSELRSDSELLGGTIELYATLLNDYIAYMVKCIKASPAESFRERALEASSIESIKSTDRKDILLEDALAIFVSILRDNLSNKTQKDYKGATEISLSVCRKDADIITGLFDPAHGGAPRAIKRSYNKKPLAKEVSGYQVKYRVEYFVFVSIIRLAAILQDMGEFEE